MASTSNAEGPSGIEQHVFEEEIEEETVWMDDEEAHHFLENGKKMRMAYGESHDELDAQETVAAEEYQEVDVEEYEEAVQVQPCNLPDLLSKRYDRGGVRVTACFSKRGSHQLACDGFLYNFEHDDGSHNTWACINPECTAHIITSYDYATIERENDIHTEMCERDEAQLSLRISIYDLRLMAEFTDAPLDKLYHGLVSQFSTENPELVDLYPPFVALQRSLEDHRRNKLFRRNFELTGEIVDRRMDEEMMHDESILLSVNGEEVVEESYSERVPMEGELATARHMHSHPYGRTRIFPPTFCFDCGIDMESNNRAFTLQHALVQHVNRIHHSIKIHTFVFEPAAFEMWLREVQRCPVLRFRRFSLLDDDMYYLCSCDMRLPKSKYSQPGCCCTAYVRINDYRAVSTRQARLVSIEYSFEHFAHDIPLDGPKTPERMIADLRPEEFLFQMERRKVATANLVRSRQEMNVTRRFTLMNAMSMRATQSPSQIMRMPEDVFSPLRSESRAAISRQVAFANKPSSSRFFRPSGSKPLDPPGLITRRANFQDLEVFESVRQFEQLSHIVTRRLQNVKNVKVAEHYSDIMRRMVNKMVSDMECAPEGSAESVWSGLKAPRNGRNPAAKRAKSEEDEEKGRVERKKKKMEEEAREAEEEGEEEETREGMKEGEEGEASEVQKDGQEGEGGDGEKMGEEVVESEGREQPKEDCEVVDESEKKGMRTRGRSQLPVRNTLVATGRVSDKEKEKEKEAGEVKEEGTGQSPKRRVTTQTARENQEKSLPQILARSKSTRIQARKEKNDGGMEEKK